LEEVYGHDKKADKYYWFIGLQGTNTIGYLRADPTEKLEAIDAAVPPSLKGGEFRVPDKLIALLQGD